MYVNAVHGGFVTLDAHENSLSLFFFFFNVCVITVADAVDGSDGIEIGQIHVRVETVRTCPILSAHSYHVV